MNNFLHSLLSAILLFGFTSCEKDEDQLQITNLDDKIKSQTNKAMDIPYSNKDCTKTYPDGTVIDGEMCKVTSFTKTCSTATNCEETDAAQYFSPTFMQNWGNEVFSIDNKNELLEHWDYMMYLYDNERALHPDTIMKINNWQ